MNRILRLVLVVCLTGWALAISGQEVKISKSTDVIVLRGKSYYLHTVRPGQTLFSICKAYGVSVEEVKGANEKKDESLRLYEVLKIPYVEPFVQQDDEYYYHKVEPGETLYSIARKYEIKPKHLLKFNAEYEYTSLSVGTVVKLPLKEITLPKEENKKVMESKFPSMDTVSVKSISADGQIAIGEHVNTTKEDTLPVPMRAELFRPEFRPDSFSDRMNKNIRVALLLPLWAKAYPEYRDSVSEEVVTLSERSEMFIGFYEGILLAVDSLKSRGYRIDLHVFDTERSSEKTYLLADEINRLQPDLIIGPVYASVYKVLADRLLDKNIPLIYPLSARSEQLGVYPNFVQVNASLESVARHMLQWLEKKRMEANVLYLDVMGTKNPEALENIQFKDRLLALEGVRAFTWNMEEVPLDSLRVLLLPDRENIIVLPEDKEGEISKILPLLSALTDNYRLSVLGLPEWQTFTSIDHETFYKLNTQLFTYSYVDYASETVKRVSENYRKYFCAEPSTLVFKAFDMGMYFMELVAKYGRHALAALEHEPRSVGCSQFYFQGIPGQAGKENNGFYIIHFTSDYQLKMIDLRK